MEMHSKPDECRTYTVGQMADMSGTSVRALRHYEEIGLLSPARTASGYRLYTPADVERLQQILLFRACGLELARIRELLESPSYNPKSALLAHLETLQERKEELEILICTVQKTIDALEGNATMKDNERFEGLKRAAVERNEQTYGKEARERYGDAAIDAANEKLLAMDQKEWDTMNELEEAIIEQLATARDTQNPAGPEAAHLAAMHAQWIRAHWGGGAYNREAHRALAQGYLADERFREYYDSRAGAGATEFLVAALEANL